MIKGIIFDLDGVICSTDQYHYQARKEMADREGIYFDWEINKRLRGVSRMESLDIILEKASKNYTDEQKLEMATGKNERYKVLLDNVTPNDCFPGVIESLKKLKRLGIKIAIGSSSKNATSILHKLGIYDLFDAVADGNDITKSKPDPEVFLVAAKRLGLKPTDCYVVEDAEAGIDAAKSGGFTSVGINDAENYYKTDIKIKNVSDLLEIL